jgi:hypothetical protein
VREAAFCTGGGQIYDRHNVPVGTGDEDPFREPADRQIEAPNVKMKYPQPLPGSGQVKNDPTQGFFGGHFTFYQWIIL